jgi:hypothetical protein
VLSQDLAKAGNARDTVASTGAGVTLTLVPVLNLEQLVKRVL